MELANGDVVVFTDANTAFARDALRAIVRPLADSSVGGVAGNQVYTSDDSATEGMGERSYWDFDRLMKRAESAAGSTVSATGAIYALRRSLVPTIIAGVTDDFYTSTAVIDQGSRPRLRPRRDRVRATGYDERAASTAGRSGSSAGDFEASPARRALLDPRRTGFYAIQLAWHKVLRRLMAGPVLLAGAMSLLPRPREPAASLARDPPARRLCRGGGRPAGA